MLRVALQVKRVRKPAATEVPEEEAPEEAEAEPEVDTTGLNKMQAWAARRAAKRAGENKKATAARKDVAAPRKRASTRVRAAPGLDLHRVCRSSMSCPFCMTQV